MVRVEDHQPLDALGVVHGQQPDQRAAPVVPGDRGRAGARDRARLVVVAYQTGLVSPHPARLTPRRPRATAQGGHRDVPLRLAAPTSA
jgi:hypothetical protein